MIVQLRKLGTNRRNLAMNKQILNKYEAWLVHQEYSQATIEKYTHALRRFLRKPVQAKPRA